MKRISAIVGLCLVAALAISAVGAAGASAKEVLFKLGSGSFPATFTSKGPAANPSAKLVTLGGTEVVCTDVTNTGTIEDAHLGKVSILFLGCTTKTIVGTFNCTTAGNATGHITITNALYHLGLAHPGDVPGIEVLLPGGEIKFSCEIGEVKVTGEGVIGELEKTAGGALKVGEAVSAANLVYEQESTHHGMQLLTTFLLSLKSEESMTAHLTSEIFGTKEEAAQVSTDTLEKFENSAKVATTIELVEG